jgi:nitrite transporter
MFARTLNHFAQVAAEKAAFARDTPGAFLVSSMMAGAYVGIGIILIFTLGQQVEPALRSLVMGSCFGIALTLVVFAGSDLFTGHTMFMTIGVARGSCDLAALARTRILSWVGNLIGSALLAAIFWLGGGGQILKEGADLIFAASAAKMNAPAVALIARGALCNWLVCLALWTSARASSDAAKCILIWWCLFAFIAAGFEHSVANIYRIFPGAARQSSGKRQFRRRLRQSGDGDNRQHHRRRRVRGARLSRRELTQDGRGARAGARGMIRAGLAMGG